MFWRRVPLLALTYWASGLLGQTPEASGVDRLIQEAFARNREILAVRQRGAASDGQEAFDLYNRFTGPIHLVLTDVRMPRLFRLGWKWRERSAVKITERTREEDTKAL